MYAIVKVADRQVQVSQGQRVKVPRLPLDEGASHTFTDVLMVVDDGKTHVGAPFVSGAAIEAKVLGHGRDKKVIVFKMKRRKKYRRRNGHRQAFTELEVGKILLDGKKPKAKAKEKARPKAKTKAKVEKE